MVRTLPITETVCGKCGFTPEEETSYCGECGAEDPWEEQPVYEFDEDDLPIVFSYGIYNDTFGLWDEFCDDYFGARVNAKDVANLTFDHMKMKYCTPTLWYAITENLELEGPFLSEEAARTQVQGGRD